MTIAVMAKDNADPVTGLEYNNTKLGDGGFILKFSDGTVTNGTWKAESYWVMWNIPGTLTSLPKNAEGIGETGAGFRGETGYEPPHSQGPGNKTYVLHLYALSAAPDLTVQASSVDREALLAAMDGRILATADLSVIYARSGEAPSEPDRKPRPR